MGCKRVQDEWEEYVQFVGVELALRMFIVMHIGLEISVRTQDGARRNWQSGE